MDFEILFLFALAGWRLSSLFNQEEGPFNIFGRIREFIGITAENGQLIGTNEIAKIFACIWCLSIWVALGLWLAYLWFPVITMGIAIVLALSTLIIVVDGLANN